MGEGSRPRHSADVDAVKVIRSKGCIALGALSLAGVVARLDTVKAEDMEAFGEDSVLLACVAAGAGQLGLGRWTSEEGVKVPGLPLRDKAASPWTAASPSLLHLLCTP